MGQPPRSADVYFCFLLLVSSFLTSLSFDSIQNSSSCLRSIEFSFCCALSFLLFWLMASCWVSYKSLLRHFFYSIAPNQAILSTKPLFSLYSLQIKTRRRWRLNNNSSHGSTPATSKPPTVHRPKTNGSRWEENAPPNRKFVSYRSSIMTRAWIILTSQLLFLRTQQRASSHAKHQRWIPKFASTFATPRRWKAQQGESKICF